MFRALARVVVTEAARVHTERMLRHRTRALVFSLAVVASTVVAVGAPAVAQTGEGSLGPALLVAVQVEDMGTFDRVTFRFRDPTPLPDIFRVEYIARPVVENPSGLEIAVAGNAVLQIVMSNASGVDLTVDPPEQTYTGSTRIVADLPNVIEVVQTGDFEAVLSWAIGVRSGAGGATAQVLTDPTRVVVDVPHIAAPAVLAAPSFTG